VAVGVLVDVERERLGVFVRVTDGEPAVGPLDQQQLGGPARPRQPAAAATPSSSSRLVIDSFSRSMPATGSPTPRAADDHPAGRGGTR
jgi:hypothetical protein